MVLGRFLAGLAIGVSSALVPTYISEVRIDRIYIDGPTAFGSSPSAGLPIAVGPHLEGMGVQFCFQLPS